jgi:hypothetical protein
MASAKTFNVQTIFEVLDKSSAALKKIQSAFSTTSKAAQSAGAGLANATAGSEPAFNRLHASVQNFGGTLKDLNQKIGGVGQALLGLGGAATAMEAMHKLNETAFNSVSIQKTAQMLGLTVDQLEQLHFAAQKSGMSVEDMDSLMIKFQKSMSDASKGDMDKNNIFNELAGGIHDSTGKVKDIQSLYFQFIDGLNKRVSDPALKNGVLDTIMGKSGGEMLSFVAKGSAGIEELMAQAGRLGAAGKTNAAGSSAWAGAMIDLQGALKGVGDTMSSTILPIFAPFLESTAKWIGDNRTLTATIVGVGSVLAVVAGGIATLGMIVPPIVAGLGVLASAWGVVAATEMAALWPVGLVLAGIAAVGYAGYKIYKNWEPIKAFFVGLGESIKSFFGDFTTESSGIKDTFKDVFEFLGAGFDKIKEVIAGIGDAIAQIGSGIGKAAHMVGHGVKAGAQWVGNQATAAATAAGNSAPVKDVVGYFQGLGWSKNQAAGIAANLTQESGLRTNAVGDGGKAFGLGQWHPDRQANFSKVFGHDIRQSTQQEQLGFVDWELRNTERGAGNRLAGADSAMDAGAIISRLYERPADREGEALRRGSLAQSIANASPTLSPASAQPTNQNNQAVQVATGGVFVFRFEDAPAGLRLASAPDNAKVEMNVGTRRVDGN